MTAQEQLNAFLEHCKNLRIGKRFSFKQGSSSLRDFIEKLEKQIKDNQFRSIDEGTLVELKRTSPKDHVKYLPAIKSLAAVWATSNRYIRAGGDRRTLDIVLGPGDR
jgi:hypothetical protein